MSSAAEDLDQVVTEAASAADKLLRRVAGQFHIATAGDPLIACLAKAAAAQVLLDGFVKHLVDHHALPVDAGENESLSQLLEDVVTRMGLTVREPVKH